ncbi:hypothetical protein CR513_37139, partial [Mucuna pruriens]
MTISERKRYLTRPFQEIPIISFSNDNYDNILLHQDDPMVISVVVVEYKIERVLVEVGPSRIKLGGMFWYTHKGASGDPQNSRSKNHLRYRTEH